VSGTGAPGSGGPPGGGSDRDWSIPADVPNGGLLDRYRRLGLGTRILVWMVVGIVAGLVFGQRATVVQPLGDLFIRLLIMAAIPLVFFNLLAGLTALTDLTSLGRLATKTVAYYLFTTTLALVLGLSVMHLLKPGRGMQLSQPVDASFGDVPRVTQIILDLVPENVFRAFADGSVAQIVVFSVLLGVATLLLPEARRQPLQKGFDLAAELLRKLVDLIMKVGPLGIGALAAATVGQYGSEVFGPLALFIVGVWGAQALMVTLYMTLLATYARRSPAGFLRRTGTLWATTAATCSSLASLSVALEVAEEKLHLPRPVYAFTLPLGAQVNKDGTSIMLAGVLLFTAQAAGVEFSLAQQVTIVLVGLLLSEGSGGIPGGGLVIALIFVQAFSLPLEIAALVGGIYRLVDMGITTTNVMGDMVGTTLIAKSEGLLEESW
jgi:Na+/H+-dicarboxylate symporter